VKRIALPLLLLLLPGCAWREVLGPRSCVALRCRENLIVAVAAFQDERPEVEIGAPPVRPYPVAQDPATDMSLHLAMNFVERFNAAGFFHSAAVVEVSGSPPSAALLAHLALQGFDAVLTGNVPHCLGSTCITGGDIAGFVALRFIGLIYPVVVPLPFGMYHNEGVITIKDLRLTDTRSGEVLWQGNFTKSVVHYSGDPSPGPAIHEAMHDVAADVIADLQRQLRSGRQ
jgi:hypothetical protein